MNSLQHLSKTNSENSIKESISTIGNNNHIVIHQSQIPTAHCAEIVRARERELEQLRIENQMLRLHIDHVAQDVANIRNILIEKDKYIAALIAAKIQPPPYN